MRIGHRNGFQGQRIPVLTGTHQRAGTNLNIILMSAAVFMTIVLAMAIGIAAGYVIIIGILAAFNGNRGDRAQAAPALIANAGTTGD